MKIMVEVIGKEPVLSHLGTVLKIRLSRIAAAIADLFLPLRDARVTGAGIDEPPQMPMLDKKDIVASERAITCPVVLMTM